MFNKSFFHFLLGFILLIGVSFLIASLVNGFFNDDTQVDNEVIIAN